MFDIGLISYSTGAGAFFLLAALLLSTWRGNLQGSLLLAAVLASGLWATLAAYHVASHAAQLLHALLSLEALRDLLWCVFLLRLLHARGALSWLFGPHRMIAFSVLLIGVTLLIVNLALALSGERLQFLGHFEASMAGYVLLAICGLVLVEQVLRNAGEEGRWAIKFLCMGLGVLFAYDFFLYSNALLVKGIDAVFWDARGFANALVVPLIAVAASRNPEWSVEIFISRNMVFYSAAITGAGIYLLLMAAAGYYIRLYGGSWGGVAQVIFLFGAAVLLLVLLFSGQLRARVKLFLNKHFFHYKYDYRDEWLRFMRTIAINETNADLREQAIQAIAQIVDSPGGMLWLRQGAERYVFARDWSMRPVAQEFTPQDGTLLGFLRGRGWVIDLTEYRRDPLLYHGLSVPQWLGAMSDAWLVVPLPHGEELIGIMVLKQGRALKQLNWEDRDLLKTAARQAAGYLALLETTDALMQARQFEAFNRFSAYVVHDLKNVVAQLSLVVRNAEKHRHNPQFIEDAFTTVDNAVAKMNRMLAQLRKSNRRMEAGAEVVSLAKTLQEVCAHRSVKSPAPQFECRASDLSVLADRDRLGAVLEHVVQNAQEATADDGEVRVALSLDGDYALVEVHDTGCGMDEAFIRERLFRPFDTTKGNAGMGIGVYETREFVQDLGGKVAVSSAPGKGTVFRLFFPLMATAERYPAEQDEVVN